MNLRTGILAAARAGAIVDKSDRRFALEFSREMALK